MAKHSGVSVLTLAITLICGTSTPVAQAQDIVLVESDPPLISTKEIELIPSELKPQTPPTIVISSSVHLDDADRIIQPGATPASNETIAALSSLEKQAVHDYIAVLNLLPEDYFRVIYYQRDDARAVVFARLVKAARTPAAQRSNNEQLVLDWFGRVIQDKRVEAAGFALDEFHKWQVDGCNYMSPEGFSWKPNASACSSTPNPVASPQLKPPSVEEFQSYGLAFAYQGLQGDAAMTVAGQVAKSIGIISAMAAGAGIGAGIGASLSLGSGVVTAVYPFLAVAVSKGLVSSAAAAAAIAGSASTVVGVVVTAAIIAVLQGIDVFSGDDASEIEDKLETALAGTQNTPVDIAQLVQSEKGTQELFGAFILKTLGSFPIPQDLALPTGPQGIFSHTLRGAASGHEAPILNYKSWDGSDWTVQIIGDWFIHTARNSGESHADTQINYQSWGGGNWTAKRVGDQFLHTQEDASSGHFDTILNYRSWDSSEWTARVAYIQPRSHYEFLHTSANSGAEHLDIIMKYLDWDGSQWTTRFVNGLFVQAPNDDWSRAHTDNSIRYQTWDGTKWTVVVREGQFLHAPEGDFNRAHFETYMNYKTWGGERWTARLTEVMPPAENL